MEFNYTDNEYLTECLEGCGELTKWLQSKEVSNQAGRNHEKSTGHKWRVRERWRDIQKWKSDVGPTHGRARP